MSGIFNDPPAFGGVVNVNIKANKNQPLNLMQGSVPSGIPPDNLPALIQKTITETLIFLNLDVSYVLGTQPISYEVVYGTAPPLTIVADLSPNGTNKYIVEATGLEPGTQYSFQLIATNSAGTTTGKLWDFTTDSVPVPPPTVPPTVPTLISTTPTSITVEFDVAPTGDLQGYGYGGFYGIKEPPNLVYLVSQYAGTIYRGTITGLTPDTSYVFTSTVDDGTVLVESAVSAPFTTSGTPGIPPSSAPTVPAFVSATSTSITVSMDVAGITGDYPITYSFLVGTTTSPATPVTATLTTGTTYEGTATGLTGSTDYYFKSFASNSAGSKISAVSAPFQTVGTPPTPTALTNLAVLTFLAIDDQGMWSVNTSGMPDVGSMILTGAQAGTWSGTDGKAYLNSIRAKADTKLIVSMGGSGMNQFLAQAFPSVQGAVDLCNTIWNVLFGAGSPNTLNWANTAWAGLPNRLFFDGLDIDMEGTIGTGILAGFMEQWIINQATYGGAVGHKILTMAPQSPNTWMTTSPSTSVFTNNMTAVPYSTSDADVEPIATGFLTSDALIAPKYLQHYDYVFVQCYNQGTALYPGGVSFDPQMSQWAYLVMKARQVSSGVNTKLIFGFASTDASPLWNATTDAPALATAINQINVTVSAQIVADGGLACVPTDWCGGFGQWNSPTNIPQITAVYSSGSVLTKALVGNTAMLYANASGNNTTWTNALPLTDSR